MLFRRGPFQAVNYASPRVLRSDYSGFQSSWTTGLGTLANLSFVEDCQEELEKSTSIRLQAGQMEDLIWGTRCQG
jgi:hypothetical protein